MLRNRGTKEKAGRKEPQGKRRPGYASMPHTRSVKVRRIIRGPHRLPALLPQVLPLPFEPLVVAPDHRLEEARVFPLGGGLRGHLGEAPPQRVEALAEAAGHAVVVEGAA